MGNPNPDIGQSLQILFSPVVVPAIDVFRALHNLEHSYGSPLLDDLEADLVYVIGESRARAAISDALLFSFAVKRQGKRPLSYSAVSSRWGTRDEFSLMTLIDASQGGDRTLIASAARALGLEANESILRLAADLSKSFRPLFLGGSFSDRKKFEAVVASGQDLERTFTDDTNVKFYF